MCLTIPLLRTVLLEPWCWFMLVFYRLFRGLRGVVAQLHALMISLDLQCSWAGGVLCALLTLFGERQWSKCAPSLPKYSHIFRFFTLLCGWQDFYFVKPWFRCANPLGLMNACWFFCHWSFWFFVCFLWPLEIGFFAHHQLLDHRPLNHPQLSHITR